MNLLKISKGSASSLALVVFFLLCTGFFAWQEEESTALGNVRNQPEQESCAEIKDFASQYICWDSHIKLALAAQDIPKALRLLEVFSEESSEFIEACHSLAHQVGVSAYHIFQSGQKVAPSSLMQVCDFGFFHGFMTEFTYLSRDGKKVGTFCTQMQPSVQKEDKDFSRDACFHGIGHGSVERHDPEEWDEPLAILQATLSLCRMASETEDDFIKCAGGAYNGMAYGTYAQQLDSQKVFAICKNLRNEDVPVECYGNMAAVIYNLSGRSLNRAIPLAFMQMGQDYRSRVVSTLSVMAARDEMPIGEVVSLCSSLTPGLQGHCFGGHVSGLVQAGLPHAKQAKAYAFCTDGRLPEERRGDCFTAAFWQLYHFWSKDKIKRSCDAISHNLSLFCEHAFALWNDSLRQQPGPVPSGLFEDVKNILAPFRALMK